MTTESDANQSLKQRGTEKSRPGTEKYRFERKGTVSGTSKNRARTEKNRVFRNLLLTR